MGERLRGALAGLGAAALFGLSAPVAKRLLDGAGPLTLAGLFYLGAGASLTIVRLIRRGTVESPLRREDAGTLVAIALCGGVIGPVLMLVGLARVSGMAGSLLLNLEAPFTIAIAALVFREHLGRYTLLAAVLIVGGAAVLGYQAGESRAHWLGALAIAGACLSWAVDNNLTQRLSLRDPIALVQWKTLSAGACNLLLALVWGESLPRPSWIPIALAVGALSYGASIVLDAHALRLLGAAREAALFATAPFLGALAAIPLLDERPTVRMMIAMALMVAGVAVLIRERHHHLHTHEAIEHEHLHTHDEHHRHAHEPGHDAHEPHSHPHRHVELSHDHPHTPDLHHRHRH